MTLSVITINYNNRDGLQRTIDSVVGQSFTDYEWIVIDGGSTDGSRNMIEQYAERFAYWCSEPDSGIYNAMNKGIEHAKGDWFLFLNSGDWLYDSTVLQKVFFEPHDADILYGDVMYHWPDNRGMELDEKPEKLSLYFFYKDTLCHQATFYKKKIFNSHSYNEKYRICSDWALYIQLIQEGYRFQHLPICIVNFAQDGISTHLDEAHIAEREQVFQKYFPEYIRPDLEELKRQEEYRKYINSHKSYKRIMQMAEKRIKCAEKIIKFIEKFNRKTHNNK